MKEIKVMSVFGTRPEAIKMCPLVRRLKEDNRIKSIVCVTGQHREMLDSVLKTFEITPDYDLDIMKKNQTLSEITTRILLGMEKALKEAQPDIVLVHGDTTTSFAAALAAFYAKITVGHVEAGLRTFNRYSPYPEEMNRLLTSRLATLHFAPTDLNLQNLKNEGINENVFVTGNTVLDAFKTTVKNNYTFASPELADIDFSSKKVVLMTAHRRENIGEPLESICNAVNRLTKELPELHFIYPVHPNPAINEPVHKALLQNESVSLISPLDVTDLHNLMAKSFLVLTDSGGLQEEGPSFKKPVLVLRTETERPEAVDAGCVKVIGVSEDSIVEEVKRVVTDKDCYNAFLKNGNPYGDGNASLKIIDAIIKHFDKL